MSGGTQEPKWKGKIGGFEIFTGVCGQISRNNPASLLESFQVICDARESRAYNRHIQI
jgi:hypothetical protein